MDSMRAQGRVKYSSCKRILTKFHTCHISNSESVGRSEKEIENSHNASNIDVYIRNMDMEWVTAI